jgi:hypothetical protein
LNRSLLSFYNFSLIRNIESYLLEEIVELEGDLDLELIRGEYGQVVDDHFMGGPVKQNELGPRHKEMHAALVCVLVV